MRLSALFEEFVRYLQIEKAATPETVRSYRRRFHDFLEFTRREAPTPLLSHFTVDLCRAYQYALHERGCVANTVLANLTTLASFGKWLCRRGKLKQNPIDQLVRPKPADRLPAVPRWSVAEDLVTNGHGFTHRTKAVLALMLWGGLRRAEVVTVNVGDFELGYGLRRVRGKGNREDSVALPNKACQVLAEYLAADRAGAGPDEPMFLARYQTIGGKHRVNRMSYDRVYRIVKQVGRRAGITGLHPHAFRHACGVQLLEISGGDLVAVQDHLRHRNLQTTRIYARIAKPRLKKIVGLFDGIPGPGGAQDSQEPKG